MIEKNKVYRRCLYLLILILIALLMTLVSCSVMFVNKSPNTNLNTKQESKLDSVRINSPKLIKNGIFE